jgi:hypothetical protein
MNVQQTVLRFLVDALGFACISGLVTIGIGVKIR